MVKKGKKYNHEIYSKISHAERIRLIYMAANLKLTIKEIENITDLKYTTIRNIVFTYYRTGRTNKLTYLRSRELSRQIGNLRKLTEQTNQTQASSNGSEGITVTLTEAAPNPPKPVSKPPYETHFSYFVHFPF